MRVSDGRVRNVLGSLDAQGVNLLVDLSATAAEAKAEFLVKGVPAKLSWQRVFDAPADRQPPLRITASLDNNERTQLGLDLNDIVQGEVGVEIVVVHDAHGERHVHVRADLVNAELFLESLAWHKPKGRPSLFEFDLAKGTYLSDRAAQREAGRRQRGDRGVDGRRVRLPRQGIPLSAVLGQRGDQPRGARQAAGGQRLGGDGQRSDLRRQGFVPVVLRRQSRARKEWQDAARPRFARRDRHRGRLLRERRCAA